MIKVIGWIDYDNFNFRDAKGSQEEIEAVAKNIRENGYKFGGDDHENHCYCTPLLSNGTALRLSWRSWGYVMAVAYNLKTDKNEYNYHKRIMKYPKELDQILKKELTNLIEQKKENKEPFSSETIQMYYNKLKDITKINKKM